MEEILEILRMMQAELEGTPPEMKAELIAKWEAMAHQVWDSHLGEAMDACEGVTSASLEEKKESTPKETEVVVEPQGVPEGATDQETIGATEDQYGDQRLAIGCHRRPKKHAQGNDGPQQKFAAIRGQFTHHTVPAIRKGRLRKGPGKKCHSGIRVPGRTLDSRMEGWSLKQRRPKNNVIRETPVGQTCKKRRPTRPECNNCIRDQGARQHLILEKEKMHHKATRQSLDLEIAKLVVESSI
jgi:hypothetical protein